MVAGAGGNSGDERELVGAGLEVDKPKAKEGARPAIVEWSSSLTRLPWNLSLTKA